MRKESIVRAHHGLLTSQDEWFYPRVDLHSHTSRSGDVKKMDALPVNTYAKMVREGFDAYGPTDHNTLKGYFDLIALGYALNVKEERDDPPVIYPAVEVTTKLPIKEVGVNPYNNHIIVVTLPKHAQRLNGFLRAGKRRPHPTKLLEFVHNFAPDEMVAIIAHPLKRPGRTSMVFDDVKMMADYFRREVFGIAKPKQQLLVEVLNGYQANFPTTSSGNLSKKGRYEYKLMLDRVRLANALKLPGTTAGSDAHVTSDIGKVYTIFDDISGGKISVSEMIDMMSRGKLMPFSPRLRGLVREGVVDLRRESFE